MKSKYLIFIHVALRSSFLFYNAPELHFLVQFALESGSKNHFHSFGSIFFISALLFLVPNYFTCLAL